ncbi:transposase [Paenibacillus larvae]|nr:transposase [Paenibacillus larvae]
MLFEDESMIRDYQAIQKTCLSAGSNASFQPRASIVGSNCWPRLTMKRDTSFGKKMNSTPLKRFFSSKVMATYPTGKLALVLGQRLIHHAKLLRPFLEAQKNRLELVYLPPYSPQLNIVEGLWKWLKSSVINNVFYSAVSEIRLRVGQFMDESRSIPTPDNRAVRDFDCYFLSFNLYNRSNNQL